MADEAWSREKIVKTIGEILGICALCIGSVTGVYWYLDYKMGSKHDEIKKILVDDPDSISKRLGVIEKTFDKKYLEQSFSGIDLRLQTMENNFKILYTNRVNVNVIRFTKEGGLALEQEGLGMPLEDIMDLSRDSNYTYVSDSELSRKRILSNLESFESYRALTNIEKESVRKSLDHIYERLLQSEGKHTILYEEK